MLFAEEFTSSQWGIVGALSGIGTLLGGAVVWIAGWADARRATKRKERQEDDQPVIGLLKESLERLGEEFRISKEENKESKNLIILLTAHVRYLEGMMEVRGVPFRPLVLNPALPALVDPGSGLHRPVVVHKDEDEKRGET